MRISCSRQAQDKSERDNHHGLFDPSRPSKLGKIPWQNAPLRTKVSLDRAPDCARVQPVQEKNTIS
jgi:hypothetical protein